ncbi:FKBP-type peptidyl-prolyl cis-trans isomerase [Candidatus Nitronereus thalassa]|uniref:Peptidyl-prolyl cis-trans isomerase n=2 Tax=Candidatus Nitronereus thalassa TaxID=3020898 RepID=A0ABU3K7T2_9BACT|nr:FKBP-type peptidyl-prolyl cis-trans isomerase [Candidatus Nitronereus thalassa]MDT7042450.1 FKBP-type peptidyl-prolyl cis-trans isomerase [Candidatus Nitronereus thalassa]
MRKHLMASMVFWSVIVGISFGGLVLPSWAEEEKPTVTASGLQYLDLVKGSGREAQIGETASVHYTGWLQDGTKFDSSVDRGEPFQFRLGAGHVIKGWDEGVVGMNIGSKRKLIIPPNLGYGARGAGRVIPPNATLIFDVELLDLR